MADGDPLTVVQQGEMMLELQRREHVHAPAVKKQFTMKPAIQMIQPEAWVEAADFLDGTHP
jgi:hypothetical protein